MIERDIVVDTDQEYHSWMSIFGPDGIHKLSYVVGVACEKFDSDMMRYGDHINRLRQVCTTDGAFMRDARADGISQAGLTQLVANNISTLCLAIWFEVRLSVGHHTAHFLSNNVNVSVLSIINQKIYLRLTYKDLK